MKQVQKSGDLMTKVSFEGSETRLNKILMAKFVIERLF